MLPEIRGIPALRDSSITLGQLASHTAGLPRLPPGFFRLGRLLGIALGGDPYQDYEMAELREAAAHSDLGSAPGQSFAYSNLGMGLLGLALVQIYGADSYEDLVSSPLVRAALSRRRSAGQGPRVAAHPPARVFE